MTKDPYYLTKGKHGTAADGRCAMEWVAYLAGEPHTDSPVCVSPVLTRFCIAFNDGLDDEKRQRLRPYLARTIGTRDDGLDEHRAWLATDWLIRIYTPAWLGRAGLDEAAQRLRALPPVLAAENLQGAMVGLKDARGRMAAAEVAASNVAMDAAWTAVGVADVAGDVARVVWDAAGAAARDAAWDAAMDVAWVAVGVAAGDVAGDVARVAAGVVAGVVAKAGVSTVNDLQESAFALLDLMLPTEPVRLPVVADAEAVCALA